MQLDINNVIAIYQQEINKLMREVILLKAQLVQMQEENNKQEQE